MNVYPENVTELKNVLSCLSLSGVHFFRIWHGDYIGFKVSITIKKVHNVGDTS